MGSQGPEPAPSGWPLGLPPVTFRMRLAEAFTIADTNSFLTTSSFSSFSSSEFDTESSLSFLPEKSITLGSLVGINVRTNRSLRPLYPENFRRGRQSRSCARDSNILWSCIRFAACSRDSRDNSGRSLGDLLEAERRSAGSLRDERMYINIIYEEAGSFAPETNPLFDPNGATTTSPSRDVVVGRAADLPVIMEESPETSDRLANNPNEDTSRPKGIKSQVKRKHHCGETSNVNCVSYIWGVPKWNPCAKLQNTSSRNVTSNALAAINRTTSTDNFNEMHASH